MLVVKGSRVAMSLIYQNYIIQHLKENFVQCFDVGFFHCGLLNISVFQLFRNLNDLILQHLTFRYDISQTLAHLRF